MTTGKQTNTEIDMKKADKQKVLKIISNSEKLLSLIEDELVMHLEDLRDRGFYGRTHVTWETDDKK